MKMLLETERLSITEFTTDDAGFILQLVNSPSWLQFIGDRQVYTLADAEQYLVNGPISSYQQLGFGLWKVELKDGGKAVGMCGFLKRTFLDDADIGYALLPEFEGFGYAHEATSASLDYGRHKLAFNRVAAIVQENNSRSIQLLTKLGFKFEHMIALPGSEKELCLMYINLS